MLVNVSPLHQYQFPVLANLVGTLSTHYVCALPRSSISSSSFIHLEIAWSERYHHLFVLLQLLLTPLLANSRNVFYTYVVLSIEHGNTRPFTVVVGLRTRM